MFASSFYREKRDEDSRFGQLVFEVFAARRENLSRKVAKIAKERENLLYRDRFAVFAPDGSESVANLADRDFGLDCRENAGKWIAERSISA